MKNQAFTLIELLVVVLIIGILAAVALPQYQKAVLKSRTTQALIALRALDQAQKECFLSNGAYCTADALSISVNATCTSSNYSANCSNGDLRINNDIWFEWHGLNRDSYDGGKKGQIQWRCNCTGRGQKVCQQYFAEWGGTDQTATSGPDPRYGYYGVYH